MIRALPNQMHVSQNLLTSFVSHLASANSGFEIKPRLTRVAVSRSPSYFWGNPHGRWSLSITQSSWGRSYFRPSTGGRSCCYYRAAGLFPFIAHQPSAPTTASFPHVRPT